METSFRLDWCEPEKTHHQDDRAVLADGVQEDLCDGLTCRRSDGGIVILNREEQAEDEEPSEDRGDTDGHDDAYRSRHGRVMRLFCHVRARVEPYSKVTRCQNKKKSAPKEEVSPRTCERVLRYENADHGDVGEARALRPAYAVDARPVNERPEDKLAALVLRRRCEDGNDEGGRAERVPPHRDVVEVLEEAHAKGVDHTCGGVSFGSAHAKKRNATDLG